MSINPRSQPYRLDPPVDEGSLPQIVTNADEMFQILFEDIVALDAAVDAVMAADIISDAVARIPGPMGPPGMDGSDDSSAWTPLGIATNGFVPYVGAVTTVNLGTQTLIAGKVGIGITPTDLLHLFKTSSIQANFDVLSDTANNATEFFLRRKRTTGGVTSSADTLGGINAQGVLTDGTTQSNGASIYVFQDAASTASVVPGRIVFSTAGAVTSGERMRITSAGNVGIGTTNPLGRLTLQADTGGTGFNFNGRNNAGIDEGFLQFFKFDGTTLQGYIEGYSNKLAIGDATATEVITVTAGKAGVGNASPGFKLVVSGASADGLQIKPTGTESAANLFIYSVSAGASQRNWVLTSYSVATPGELTFMQSNAAGGNPQTAGTARLHFNDAGSIGVALTTITARLHLPAGTATASTAPLKITAGTLLTTPELGAIEYSDNGTTGHFYATVNVAGVVTRVQFA